MGTSYTTRKRELTPAQKAAAQERRERFRETVKKIAAMPEADRVALINKVGIVPTVEGHALSLHNTLLLACQCASVSIVGGFRQWKAQGRSVRKGEHGYMIWIPKHPSAAENHDDDTPQPGDLNGTGEAKRDRTRFIMGTVFDIGQTEESCGDALVSYTETIAEA